MDDTKSYLAKNMMNLRLARNLTQDALARLTELPRTTITYLESGMSNPSLDTLMKVSRGLQIGLEELLAAPRSTAKLYLKDQLKLKKSHSSLVKVYDLLPDPISGMNIEKIELSPQSRLKGSPHLSHSKEYFYCVKGQVEIKLVEASYVLAEGDLLSFDGDQAHAYFNHEKKMAVGFSVVALKI